MDIYTIVDYVCMCVYIYIYIYIYICTHMLNALYRLFVILTHRGAGSEGLHPQGQRQVRGAEVRALGGAGTNNDIIYEYMHI